MVCFPFFTSESIFWFAALTGSVFFGVKILLLLFGACAHTLHLDGADGHHDVHVDHDADSSFKSFSLISLLGFMMMFGWVGLAAHVQYQLPLAQSVVIACVAGFLTSLMCTTLIKKMGGLINPGTVFNVSDAIGKQGQVYQMIPAKGIGRIHVVVDDIIREVDAISASEEEIPSFAKVVVVKALCSKTVSVKKLIK